MKSHPQILSLEQQKMALEASALQKTVVDTMSNGAKAMKTIHGEMYVFCSVCVCVCVCVMCTHTTKCSIKVQ